MTEMTLKELKGAIFKEAALLAEESARFSTLVESRSWQPDEMYLGGAVQKAIDARKLLIEAREDLEQMNRPPREQPHRKKAKRKRRQKVKEESDESDSDDMGIIDLTDMHAGRKKKKKRVEAKEEEKEEEKEKEEEDGMLLRDEKECANCGKKSGAEVWQTGEFGELLCSTCANPFANSLSRKKKHRPPPHPPSISIAGGNRHRSSRNEEEKRAQERMMGESVGGFGESMQKRLKEEEAASLALIRSQYQCVKCKEVLIDCPQNLLQLLSCEHIVCKPCLKKLVLASIEAKRCVTDCPSPGCVSSVAQQDVRLAVDDKCFDTYVNLSLETLIRVPSNSDQSSFVKCPVAACGAVMEHVKKRPEDAVGDSNTSTDDRGNPISPEAQLHLNLHRIRCRSCGHNFCSECKREPYHTGFTCETLVAFQAALKCRFCESSLDKASEASRKRKRKKKDMVLEDVCEESECQDKAAQACLKKHGCGHPCGGVRGEKKCLPCLVEDCPSDDKPPVTGEEFCSICWVEGLSAAPSIILECNHIFHFHCIVKKLEAGWSGARIMFTFLNCPLCKEVVKHSHKSIRSIVRKFMKMKKKIEVMAMNRLAYEKLERCDAIVKRGGPHFNNPLGYAMDRFAFYECYKCKAPYYGGMKQCGAAMEEAGFDASHLVCGKCSAVQCGIASCKTHGAEHIEFKCKFCCKIATWFCWNTTHFCDDCHKKQVSGDYMTKKKRNELPACPGKELCPLHVKHPPNGTEFSLGCGLCRSAKR